VFLRAAFSEKQFGERRNLLRELSQSSAKVKLKESK
jgi:hypothetical protein